MNDTQRKADVKKLSENIYAIENDKYIGMPPTNFFDWYEDTYNEKPTEFRKKTQDNRLRYYKEFYEVIKF